MKKYTMEFVGTLIFVFSILALVASGSSLAGLAIGLTLTFLVYTGATVSGANYNPAVSLALFMKKKLSANDTVWYIVAQVLGAIVAFWLASRVVIVSAASFTGSTSQVFIAELVFTFALVSAVLHTAVSKASSGNSYFGLTIGLTVVVGAIAVGSISGGFFNPAVLVGVAMAGGIKGGTIFLILVAHVVATVLATMLHCYTVGKEK